MPSDPHVVARAFGGALRVARMKRGLSQQEVADRADLQRTYVNEVERGHRNPTLYTIHRLAAAVDVPVSALFPAEREASKS